jgi:recombination protein RecA
MRRLRENAKPGDSFRSTGVPPENTPELELRRQEVKEFNDRLKAKGIDVEVLLGADAYVVAFQSSGVPEIDKLVGGLPRGKIVEIFGTPGAGKTTLCSAIARSDSKILYVDTEDGLVNPPENVTLVREYQLEVVGEIVEKAVEEDTYDVIIVDSIASTTMRAELEGEIGDSHMGLKARIMGQIIRRLLPALRDSKTTVLLTNQLRSTMASWGPTEFTPGGKAISYAASIRLELRSNKADKAANHQRVHCTVVKSRFSKAYETVDFNLKYPTEL